MSGVVCLLPGGDQGARTASGGEPLHVTERTPLPIWGQVLGTGSRFLGEAQGVFEERLRRADEVPKLQGKRMDSALSGSRRW